MSVFAHSSKQHKEFTMNVFLTGATGYIGSSVAKALMSNGHTVTGLARTEQAAQQLHEQSITPLQGDIKNSSILTQGVREAEAVIHAASTSGTDMGTVDTAVVETVLTILEGTNKPFIYTSGSWVLGNTGDTLANEETPTNPPMLVAWRPALEQRVLASATRGVHSVVLRSALVYGHGKGIPALLVNLARQAGVARYIGNGENYWTLVHVDDLANAYVQALTKAPAGVLLNVAAEPAVRFKEIAEAAGRAAGIDGHAESWSVDEARQVLGPRFDAFVLDLRMSGAKARHLLGWVPQAPSVLDDLTHGSYSSTSINHA